MSGRFREWQLDCKVYIGDLGSGTAKHELEDHFSKFGPLKNVWVARNPPGFAFVEYDDPRDAEDAVREMDGKRFNGRRIRCEMSHGKARRSRRPPPPRQRYDSYNRGGGGGSRRSRSFSPPRRPRSYSRSRSNSRERYRRRSRSGSNERGGYQ